WSVNVQGSDLVADDDQTIDGVVAATDEAGNVGNVTATHEYGVDTTAPIADPVLTDWQVFTGEVPSGVDTNPFLFRTFTVGGSVDTVNGGLETVPTVFESDPTLGGVNGDAEATQFVLTSLPSEGTLYVKQDGVNYVKITEQDISDGGFAFSKDATFFLSLERSELSEKILGGNSLSAWQQHGVEIHAYNLDGVKDNGLIHVGNGGIGVTDKTGSQKQVENQLAYRDGKTETLVVDFKQAVAEAEIEVSNLFTGKYNEKERGELTAFKNGEEVGRWVFSGEPEGTEGVDFAFGRSDGKGSFILEDVVFDQLRFTAVDYGPGATANNDNSEYFVSKITYKTAPDSVFTYFAEDQAGNASDIVEVKVGSESATHVPGFIPLPAVEDIIAGVAVHTSGNGSTGTYANNNGLKNDAMNGSHSTQGSTQDEEGFYGVNHNGQDNLNKIDGKEALLIQTVQPVKSMTFAIKGDLNGATYSLFGSDGQRIGASSEVNATGDRIEISSQEPFSYIAFDGSSSGKSEFSVKPLGYTATSGSQWIQGSNEDDELAGGDGNDVLIGGAGNDILVGGDGDDIFLWQEGDEGSPETTPAIDVVRDFGNGNNILDIADLLQGEEEAVDLSTYIVAEQEDNDTVLYLNSQGGLSSDKSNADQVIRLEGKSFSDFGGANSSQDVIQHMLDNNQLKIDQ
ncbi:MAG: type I secretion C-terminal target domain-containing protein, partial [Halomonas sp.]